MSWIVQAIVVDCLQQHVQPVLQFNDLALQLVEPRRLEDLWRKLAGGQPLAGFLTNPEGSAIVNAIGLIRQIVRDTRPLALGIFIGGSSWTCHGWQPNRETLALLGSNSSGALAMEATHTSPYPVERHPIVAQCNHIDDHL
jgi:hypothetical protein